MHYKEAYVVVLLLQTGSAHVDSQVVQMPFSHSSPNTLSLFGSLRSLTGKTARDDFSILHSPAILSHIFLSFPANVELFPTVHGRFISIFPCQLN